ncbi:N-acetylmuramoyl-L-alanine amidase [Viridibacillus sp. FSL R5-0468]|uniref:N-acetylmuramoyl-L-alanine amidase n=1 Tax=Viridibacillus sp. FSL R5-0468 TaxID=2921640 RepID=UPI0030FBB274
MAKTIKIAVCAGHGKHTAGKRSPADEREWHFNNQVVKALIKMLEKYENVLILRLDDPTGETDVSLSERVNRANEWGADIYISCHHNALTSKWGDWTGVETFVMTPKSANPSSLKLAKEVHPLVVEAMGLRDRGIKDANYAVLRDTKMPAILVEGGFMDSTIDIVKMRDTEYLKAQGEAIAKGAAVYLGAKLKEVTTVSKPSKPVSKPSNTEEYYKKGVGAYRIKKPCGAYNGVNFSKSKKEFSLKKGEVFTIVDIVKHGNAYRLKTKSGLYITAKKEFVEKV